MDDVNPKNVSILVILREQGMDALFQEIIEDAHDGLVCEVNVVC